MQKALQHKAVENVHRLFQLPANRLVFVTYHIQLIDLLVTCGSDSQRSVTSFDAFSCVAVVVCFSRTC